MGETFAEIASSGPLLLGLGVAAVAGLVSFLSPCILPLVPGYLAYVTGLSGADLATARTRPAPATPVGRGGSGSVGGAATPAGAVAAPGARVRGRILAGGLLFIAGFGTVFVTAGVLAAAVGRVFQEHQRVLEVAGGLLIIAFGLALLGLVPGMQREVRIRHLPAAGMAGAPVFGAVFALSWIPCVGPTLSAVLLMGATGGQPGRAAALAAAYTLGLGLPFLAFGLGFRTLIGAVTVVRRHSVWVTRVGAALLFAVGLALLTGAWGEFVIWLRATAGVGTVSI